MTNSSTEIAWQPEPKQLIALGCPAFELFYGGARFGGKSDFLLMDFLDGIKLGENHRGIIFRKSYSELEELTFRSKQLYPHIGGDYSETKRTWTFSGGSALKMRFLEIDRDVEKYQGHQYCVAKGTRIVMGDGSPKRIEDIEIGEKVMTLEGPRAVLDKIKPYKTLCVQIANKFGTQINPVTHPISTNAGWQSYASIQGIGSKGFEGSPQEFLRLPFVSVNSRLHKPSQDQDEQYQHPTTEYYSPRKWPESYPRPKEEKKEAWSGLSLLLEQVRSFFDRIAWPLLVGGEAYGRYGLQTVPGYPASYSPCFGLYDGPPRPRTRTAQGSTPLSVGVEEPYPFDCRPDAQDNTQGFHQGVWSYDHPYTGQARLATEESVFVPSIMAPFGEAEVYDLTVDQVNHYISYDTHLVNKNTWIGFDELTNWAADYCYTYMHSCARSPYGLPVRVRGSGNPGSAGHGWVKNRFVDVAKPMTIFYSPDTGLPRVFIPSTLDDNSYAKNDPDYERRLKGLPAHLYRAHRFGDWSVFVGQAFDFTDQFHVIKPIPIPESAPLYMTFDWGFGRPFSTGWWWTDSDGRVYRCGEWYGWTGKPNEGIRLNDTEIAAGIKKKQEAMGIGGRKILAYAGPDCFAKKPDYKGGGQGPSTAEVFAQNGVFLTPGDPSRALKIRQFRQRLMVPRNDKGEVIDAPMLQVYSTCTEFIRTIPSLVVDPTNPEDIDTNGEDHIYDEACHIAMARPLTPAKPKEVLTDARKHIEKIERGQASDYEQAARVAALTAWRDLETGLPKLRGAYSDVDGR